MYFIFFNIRLMVIDYRIGKYVLLGSIVNNKVYFEILKIFYYQNIKELLEENSKFLKLLIFFLIHY